MATVGVLNSTKVGIYVGGVLVGHLTDASISMTHDPRETTSKDSQGWKEFLEGIRGATISGTAWYTVDHPQGADDLFALLNSRQQATIKIASSEVGDRAYEINGYITNLNINSPGAEQNVSYDFSFVATGAVTETVVA